MLTELNERVFIIDAKPRSFSLPLGMRMAIVRLDTGNLLVYSPLPWQPDIQDQINSIGQIQYLFYPNHWEYQGAQNWKKENPDTQILCPEAVFKKINNIAAVQLEQDGGSLEQAPEFLIEKIQGMPAVNEYVLFHKPTGTLLTADMLYYFPNASGLFYIFCLLNGITDFPRSPITWRLLIKNRERYERSINRIRGWEVNTLFMRHGECIKDNAEKLVADGLAAVFENKKQKM